MMASKRGCVCCSFDLFLPEGIEALDNPAATEIPDEESPLGPQQAIDLLLENASKEQPITILDTHGHPHLERDHDDTYGLDESQASDRNEKLQCKAITCAVEPKDWRDTLQLASQSKSILPALGVHPWYLEGLSDNWIHELEDLISDHPSALVGEIGLCKIARFVRQHPEGKAAGLAIQRDVFAQQMKLAAKLRRPVTVHCVNQHGVFVSVIKEICESAEASSDRRFCLPPTIAMHSFTGTAHQVKELIKLEKEILGSGPAVRDVAPIFYFGFSHAVNYAMCSSEKSRRKGKDAVMAVPHDRLLVESDVHSSEDVVGGTAGAIAYVAWARKESITEIATATTKNGFSFISPVTKE